MASSDAMVRLAFAITDGPNVGLRCGGWRIKVRRDDIYISTAGTGSIVKASLHGDDSWRIAPTKEHSRKAGSLNGYDHQNPPWRLQPTKFDLGQRILFTIAASRSSLRHEPADAKELVVEVRDRWDEVALVILFETEGENPPRMSGDVLAGPLPRGEGRHLWILSRYEHFDEAPAPSAPPDGVMVRVYTPEDHGVPAPTYLTVGLRAPEI